MDVHPKLFSIGGEAARGKKRATSCQNKTDQGCNVMVQAFFKLEEVTFDEEDLVITRGHLWKEIS
ncbi:hypothetical protein N7495_002198 [Penicillium taxi]|uniref:uncharacterized protein n=1 Tax=Penicillium taxi TaxID=168475 RepID=UPI0025459DB1|nr:uncharacterized protein N7495_002198 [Penicillium taxi]KAJ5901670.1 hypothetical protein N7495_002198 [Penicillium taxi]